jgi:hypothetical protein
MAAPAPDPPGHANADSDLPAGRDLADISRITPISANWAAMSPSATNPGVN